MHCGHLRILEAPKTLPTRCYERPDTARASRHTFDRGNRKFPARAGPSHEWVWVPPFISSKLVSDSTAELARGPVHVTTRCARGFLHLNGNVRFVEQVVDEGFKLQL